MMISWWRHDDVIEESPTQRLFVQKTVLKCSFHPCNDIRVLDQFDTTSMQHALKNVMMSAKISVNKKLSTNLSGFLLGIFRTTPGPYRESVPWTIPISHTMDVSRTGPWTDRWTRPVRDLCTWVLGFLKIETKCDSNRKVRKIDEMAFYN